MNWIDRNYPWVMLALAVLLAPVIVGFLTAGVVSLLAGAISGASIGALLADAAAVVGLTALMVLAEVLLTVSFVVSVVRRASFPTSERLSTVFSRLEWFLPPLRNLRLSRRFAPSVEEREREIKRRYVDGELTEAEFEREMRDLLAETEPEPALADHADPLDAVEPDAEGRERTGRRPATDLLRSERYRESE